MQGENKNQNWALIVSTETGYWDSQMTDLSLSSLDLHPNRSGNQQSRNVSQLTGMQNKWYKINYLVFNFKFEFFNNFISCTPIQLTPTHTPPTPTHLISSTLATPGQIENKTYHYACWSVSQFVQKFILWNCYIVIATFWGLFKDILLLSYVLEIL